MKKEEASKLLKQLKASLCIEETKRKCHKELDKAFSNLAPISLNDRIKCISIVYVEESVK